jgi:uracil-DNA glycosylase
MRARAVSGTLVWLAVHERVILGVFVMIRRMANNKLAKRLTDTLPNGSPTLFNPWRDDCADCKPGNGPDVKLARLAAHLDCDPEFILCGEAPGYCGCRHSGIAFTSEHLLLAGKIPRIAPMSHRLTTKERPYKERSATIVWKALYNLGIHERTVLWNAVQMHPHKLGDEQSNRTPTPAEVAIGKPALRILIDAFPAAKVIAVGKKAQGLLDSMGIVSTASVRHPANGGAIEFTQGLGLLL